MAFSEQQNKAVRDRLVQGDFRLRFFDIDAVVGPSRILASNLLEAQLKPGPEVTVAPLSEGVEFGQAEFIAGEPSLSPGALTPPGGGLVPSGSLGFDGSLVGDPSISISRPVPDFDSYLVKDSSSIAGLRSVGPVLRDGILRRISGEFVSQGNFNNAAGVRFFISDRDASGVANFDPAVDHSVFAASNSDTLGYPHIGAGTLDTGVGWVPPARFGFALNKAVQSGQFLTLGIAGFTVSIAWAIFEVDIAGEDIPQVLFQTINNSITEQAAQIGNPPPYEDPFPVFMERAPIQFGLPTDCCRVAPNQGRFNTLWERGFRPLLSRPQLSGPFPFRSVR